MSNDLLFNQEPFGAESFADNPEPRCPCILLLDTSGSMRGNPIRELNEGLKTYKEELASDSLASKRVETAIITFGPVQLQSTFSTVNNLFLPELEAGGDTPMGTAIELAIDMLNQRKAEYRSNAIQFYRPWIFLITDGAPTDAWSNAANKVREGEEKKSFAFFAVGVEDADLTTIAKISSRPPLKLRGLQFRELFVWLSNSMKAVSQSALDSSVKLLPPTGWTEV